MTTATTPVIGSLAWERQRGPAHEVRGGYVVDDGIDANDWNRPYLELLATDATAPIVQWRYRGARQVHSIPTVRLVEVPTASIEPLTVSPPSLPQMHKVARQALATVAIGRGPLSDTERELLGYAATLMEAV